MLRFLVVAALACGLGCPVFCQQPTVRQVRQVPDYVIYEAFFFRVNWLEEQAAKRVRDGKPDDFFRSQIRRRAGLTAQEEATLKAVAADWKSNYATLLNEAREAKTSGALPERLQEVQVRRRQAVLDRVAQLREAFGFTRFFILDAFIHVTSTVKASDVVRK